ncbi:biosynthetic peptidoglycan transglycosylase [Flavobacterium alkalisoli]|uniref:biosynthetic peptidoglycan transglycosylase n=1 Tax=Flavobacterium alkalisoli TaxID=2602769 RepID=UPI00197A7612|nr:biosynthetic peptidoglycan transglycosylase [Flavobacterium alkalisoli]
MDNKAEQYYPTYVFKKENRDVVLIEFEEAQKLANSQTKIYAQVASILVALTAIIIPFFFNQQEKNLTIFKNNSILFSIIATCLGAFLLRYFVELQRQITFNARKVVTLRSMLGLDYGNIHLTIPNNRVEGAKNPFEIRFFNGWLWFQSVPFWILTVTINFIWFYSLENNGYSVSLYVYIIIHLIVTCLYYYIFRCKLYELHETFYLQFVQLISRIFAIKLLPNFEYILYRAKLSYIDLDRLGINYENLKRILIDIEDQNFYSNKGGISIKSTLRAGVSRFKRFRNKYGYIESGGSTITMQLTRTLFIPSNQNKYRRKFIEILLSIWLSHQFNEKEILKMYISSVRFERGVMGLSDAIKYFFTERIKSKNLTEEESFF